MVVPGGGRGRSATCSPWGLHSLRGGVEEAVIQDPLSLSPSLLVELEEIHDTSWGKELLDILTREGGESSLVCQACRLPEPRGAVSKDE